MIEKNIVDSRFIILGKCLCGQQLALDQMIDGNTAKCFNCNAEFHVRKDMEPLLTIEELECIETERVDFITDERILPF